MSSGNWNYFALVWRARHDAIKTSDPKLAMYKSILEDFVVSVSVVIEEEETSSPTHKKSKIGDRDDSWERSARSSTSLSQLGREPTYRKTKKAKRKFWAATADGERFYVDDGWIVVEINGVFAVNFNGKRLLSSIKS